MTAPAIPPSATIVVAGDLVASEFGDEIVILSLRDGVYYGLEDVGARIWRMLHGPVSVIDIRDAILAEYDVEPTRCEQDVCAVLAHLAEMGLVEIRKGT